VDYWEKSVKQAFKELRSRLRELQTQRRQIQLALQTYSPEDPAPYGQLASQLDASLRQIQSRLDEVERDHVALQEEARQLKANSSWLRTLTGAPLHWQRLNKECNQLKSFQSQIQTLIQPAMELVKSLENISLEAARQARRLWKLGSQTQQWLQRLQQLNVQGQAFDAAQENATILQQKLKEIPADFINGSQSEILENSSKESVSQVWALVEVLNPQLESLLAQGMEWEKQRNQAVESVESLQHGLRQTQTALQQAPQTLELGSHKEQIQHIQTVAQTLQQTLERLEIESIPLVVEEAARLSQIVQALHSQLIQAQEQSPQLEDILNHLSQELKNLSFLVGALATKSTYPVQWTQSSASLAALNRQSIALGAASLKRTPQRVIQDLENARQIESQLQTLSQHCSQVDEQHTQVLGILESAEFTNLPVWLKNAQQITAQVSEYAAENWARQDAVASLPADLQQFQIDSQNLIPEERSTPITENELSQRLTDLIQIAENYQKLRNRLEQIHNRLKQLQEDEQNAHEQVESLQASLSQIAFLVRSNQRLEQVASQEVAYLSRQIESHAEALAQRQQDVLERKTKAIQTTAIRLEQSIQQWLDELSQNIRQNLDTLAENLGALDAIAPLKEGAIDEARRTLSAGQAYRGNLAFKSRQGLADLLPELKRRSDFWQTCSSAAQALSDQAVPLLEAHQAAAAARKTAQETLAEAADWLRQSRGWPPTTFSLEAERSEFNQLEARWQAQQNSPGRAIQLVGQLGQISGQYQTLVGKVRQGVERAAHEQSQVEELESDLQELGQRWQEQWQAYQDEPEISQEIRTLLNDLERELSAIRRKAQQKGSSYDQTLQALKALHRKVRFFQVALDEEHALDASGNVQRRR
jgi:chromosome segregation ATPase